LQVAGSPGCALSALSARVNHMAAVVSMLEEFEGVLTGKDDVKVLVKGQRLRAATAPIRTERRTYRPRSPLA
jgi:hypothetical protein